MTLIAVIFRTWVLSEIVFGQISSLKSKVVLVLTQPCADSCVVIVYNSPRVSTTYCGALEGLYLKVYNFSEKTKSFYCPDGSTFYTKSKDLRIKTKSSCSSSCWSRADGCSAAIFTTLMNKQFEVIIINLYSYEQKFILTSISVLPLVGGQGRL